MQDSGSSRLMRICGYAASMRQRVAGCPNSSRTASTKRLSIVCIVKLTLARNGSELGYVHAIDLGHSAEVGGLAHGFCDQVRQIHAFTLALFSHIDAEISLPPGHELQRMRKRPVQAHRGLELRERSL